MLYTHFDSEYKKRFTLEPKRSFLTKPILVGIFIFVLLVLHARLMS